MRTLAIVFITLFTAAAYGQTVQETVAGFEQPDHYRVDYDRFKDVTTILSPNYPTANSKGKRRQIVGVQIIAAFAGKEPEGEIQYAMIFSSPAILTAAPDVIMLTDGKRITLSNGYPYNELHVARGILAGIARESGRVSGTGKVVYEISAEQLMELAATSVVEFQFLDIEGILGSDITRTIRELLQFQK